jgi:hypothetical protein
MPYKDKSDRNYKREYEQYQGTEEQKKRRAARNAARAVMAKKGLVHKGDGMDVDHKKPLSKGGNNKGGNLRVQTAHNNRSFPRKKDHSIK